MSESFEASVTAWIRDLKHADDDAARKLWDRYFERLVRMAERKLGDASRRVADGEDVALSVFQTLCAGAAAGQFQQLTHRDDLWKLLVAITSMKAVDQIRRQTSQKRGSGEVRGDSIVMGQGPGGDAGGDGPAGFEQFIAQEPTPEYLALLNEEHQRLLGLLRDDTQRQIAELRMQGYANQEIADKLNLSIRSVERKLNLIRETWEGEMG